MLLTEEERVRFAEWLEREAEAAKLVIEQMEKLGAYTAPFVAREKLEAGAAIVIARKLRGTEGVSIG